MSASDPISALRLRLLANNYEPIPVVGPDFPGKSPGKRPLLDSWQSVEVTPDAIRSWSSGAQRGCINTGLRCGILAGIDIDILNQDLAHQVEQLAIDVFGPTPLKRIGRAPKLLLCYRFGQKQQKALTKEYLLPDGTKAQVEILGDGQQFVSYGVHAETRQEYEWPESGPDTVPLNELPLITEQAVEAFVQNAIVLIEQAGGTLKKKAADATSPHLRPITGAATGQGRPDGDFFRNVNTAALKDAGGWMRSLFGSRVRQEAGTGAWRVRSKDLGRSEEEDLSVHPVHGGRDFGTEHSLSPIDIVMEHGGAADAKAAALWLCQELGIDPASLGWAGGRGSASNGFHQPEPLNVVAGKVQPVREIEWPEPIDFMADGDLTGVPTLERHHIPEALYGFVTDTAERMGVDPAAVALSAIISCASVAIDDWKLQPKQHDDSWTERPRLWGAIVGDPSILKSPVINACTTPIDALEVAARKVHAEDFKRYRAELAAWKKESRKPDGEPGDEPRPPRLDRYMVESTTTEALSEVLRDDDEAKMRAPARKVLVRQDEMSEWIGGMDKYRAGGGGGSDRGAYLRLYNGGRHTIDRVMRGSFSISNWSACFLGGIQPGPIQRIASNAEEDGLLQRFCYCVPGVQGPNVDRTPDHSARHRYEGIIRAMTALTPSRDVDTGEPIPVKLHTDAHNSRKAINDLAEVMSIMPDTSPRLKAAYGKWPGLYARLTLTFHLIQVADARARGVQAAVTSVVQPDTARMAAAYLEQVLLPHLQRADSLMFATKQTSHARWIAGFILSRGVERIATRDIIQAYRDLRSPETRATLYQVMETLVMIGWVLPEDPPNPARQPTAWKVNPAVLERFAARGDAERARRKESQERMAEIIRAKAGQVIR